MKAKEKDRREHTLTEYTRNKKRQKTGVLVAFVQGDNLYCGWSKCNTKLDKFNRELGKQIATERAKKYFEREYFSGPVTAITGASHVISIGTRPIIPQSIRTHLAYFLCKSEHYFNNNGNQYNLPTFTDMLRTHYDVNNNGKPTNQAD